jgi:uncharacterized RDD family membrane protein YckC
MQNQGIGLPPGTSQPAPNESALEPNPAGNAQSYASVGLRLAAYLLDVSISFLSVTVPVYLILEVLIATGAWVPTQRQPDWGGSRYVIAIAFFLAMGPIYFVICHASPWQATAGKRLLKLYVVGSDGNRISLGRSSIRSLAFYVLGAFGAGLISVITIADSKQRKGVHDFIAGTSVLRGRPVPGGKLGHWRIAASIGFPVAWMLGTLLATA